MRKNRILLLALVSRIRSRPSLSRAEGLGFSITDLKTADIPPTLARIIRSNSTSTTRHRTTALLGHSPGALLRHLTEERQPLRSALPVLPSIQPPFWRMA